MAADVVAVGRVEVPTVPLSGTGRDPPHLGNPQPGTGYTRQGPRSIMGLPVGAHWTRRRRPLSAKLGGLAQVTEMAAGSDSLLVLGLGQRV